ncbi:MAG: ion channel [Planctomycetota bacterium]
MRRFRYAYLLASLTLVVFVRPFVSGHASGIAAVDVLLFVTLLAGAYAAIDQKRWFVGVATIGVVSAVAQAAFVATKSPVSTGVFLAAGLLFYISVTWAILRTLFGDHGRVTRDTLYQSISVYLLLGMIGAMAYAMLELAAPGSFRFAEELAGDKARFERFVGFSFTTLTTLGYGNVAPASPRADALSTFQAVTGQVYLAVVIARLVAIEVGQHQANRKPGSG